ncbi:hypothetical protein EON65_16475 [archaeon]|nr:MAG: hypothetical protein EON65_16475 [archaeon]
MVNSLDPFSSLLARYAEIYRQYEIELPKCCISHSPLSPQPGEKLMYPLITSPSHPSSNPTLPPVPAQAASRSTPAHNNIVLNSTGFQSMPTSFNPTPPIFTQTFIPTSAPTPASSSTRNPHSISKATPNLTVISTANPSQSTVMNPPPKPLPNPNSVLPRHPFHVTLLPTPSSPNSLPLPVSSITLPTTKDPNSTNPAPLVPSPSAAIPIPNPIPTPTYASITASIATPNPTTIPQAQPSPPVSTTQVPPPSPAIRWRVTW